MIEDIAIHRSVRSHIDKDKYQQSGCCYDSAKRFSITIHDCPSCGEVKTQHLKKRQMIHISDGPLAFPFDVYAVQQHRTMNDFPEIFRWFSRS
jgi:hypothetical protein